MRYRSISFLFVLSVAAACLPSSAFAAREMTLDHVEGICEPGTIHENTPITFHIRWTFTPGDGSGVVVFWNGFRLYSPDGAVWQPMTWDTVSLGWPDMFDIGFHIHLGSITGYGADTVLFGGVPLMIIPIRDGWDKLVWSFSTQVDGAYYGKTLCLDSSSLMPYEWMWQVVEPSEVVVPDWSGPHCFTIGCCLTRGDINRTGSVDVADITYLVAYLFQSGPPPPCPEEADVDASGFTDVGDLTYLVAYLFQGGPAPSACP